MTVNDREIKDFLISKGYHNDKKLKDLADALLEMEANKVKIDLINKKLELLKLDTYASMYEDLPTIKECAEFIGAKFNTVNMSGQANKAALRYGLRELKRLNILDFKLN